MGKVGQKEGRGRKGWEGLNRKGGGEVLFPQ